jgi:prepilin-type processing-associated H-X9-DG protein
LATTLLIGETIGSMNPRWLQAGPWPGETNHHAPALGFPIVGAQVGFSSLTETTLVINPPAIGAFNTRTGLVPSSAHPGGAVVAFADGSSRFLKNDLRPWVFAHLFTSRSSWDPSGPANRKYSSNSLTANRFLLLSGSASAYSLKIDDY